MPITQRRNTYLKKTHDQDAPENIYKAVSCFGHALTFLCGRLEIAQAGNNYHNQNRNTLRKNTRFFASAQNPQSKTSN